MASTMGLKRKACYEFEQQSRAKIQTTSSRNAAEDLMSSVQALIQQAQHTGHGVTDNDGGASADADRRAKIQTTSSHDAAKNLMSSVRALIQQAQHTGHGVTDNDGGASADADRIASSFGDDECKASRTSSSADEQVVCKSTPIVHSMTTRRRTKFMVFNAVLNTRELLEHIIFDLPPEAIVRLRQVNKIWNHIILTLPCIRRKIFLDPEPSAGYWVFDTVTQRLRPYVSGMSSAYGDDWTNRQCYSSPVQLNTMLFKRDDRAETSPISQRATICESLRLVARPHLLKRYSLHRDMLVTQPPVKIVEFTVYYHDRERKRQGLTSRTLFCRIKVTRPHGVRLGDVLNEFFKHATVQHWYSNGQNSTLPRPDWFIRVAGNTRRKTAIWTLGGIYVSGEEKAAVEKLRDTIRIAAPVPTPTLLSPQAVELKTANNGRKFDFRTEEARGAAVSGSR